MKERTPPPIRENMFSQAGVLSKIWVKFFHNLYDSVTSSDQDVSQIMANEPTTQEASKVNEIEEILTMLQDQKNDDAKIKEIEQLLAMLPSSARDFMALIVDLEMRLSMLDQCPDYSRKLEDIELRLLQLSQDKDESAKQADVDTLLMLADKSDHGNSGILDEAVWDDMRITPGSFDRPGASDPTFILYYPNGGGLGTLLPEFEVDDYACFTIQLPHTYKQGTDIYAHIHWTPGPRGNEENGKTVGWKIDFSWANIGDNFSDMQTLDLSDACDGTDHKHQMTDEVVIDGHTAPKGISSMLICNVRRSDTGADDTWVGTISGQLPLLLEIDFHYQIDAAGSHLISTK